MVLSCGTWLLICEGTPSIPERMDTSVACASTSGGQGDIRKRSDCQRSGGGASLTVQNPLMNPAVLKMLFEHVPSLPEMKPLRQVSREWNYAGLPQWRTKAMIRIDSSNAGRGGDNILSYEDITSQTGQSHLVMSDVISNPSLNIEQFFLEGARIFFCGDLEDKEIETEFWNIFAGRMKYLELFCGNFYGGKYFIRDLQSLLLENCVELRELILGGLLHKGPVPEIRSTVGYSNLVVLRIAYCFVYPRFRPTWSMQPEEWRDLWVQLLEILPKLKVLQAPSTHFNTGLLEGLTRPTVTNEFIKLREFICADYIFNDGVDITIEFLGKFLMYLRQVSPALQSFEPTLIYVTPKAIELLSRILQECQSTLKNLLLDLRYNLEVPIGNNIFESIEDCKLENLQRLSISLDSHPVQPLPITSVKILGTLKKLTLCFSNPLSDRGPNQRVWLNDLLKFKFDSLTEFQIYIKYESQQNVQFEMLSLGGMKKLEKLNFMSEMSWGGNRIYTEEDVHGPKDFTQFARYDFSMLPFHPDDEDFFPTENMLCMEHLHTFNFHASVSAEGWKLLGHWFPNIKKIVLPEGSNVPEHEFLHKNFPKLEETLTVRRLENWGTSLAKKHPVERYGVIPPDFN